MRILLTNDDGIEAPGLKVMERIARALSDDVWVVAPSHERSGVSRAVSLHNPLRVENPEPKRYHVSGTPADCVIAATKVILKDKLPDLVLSGVNRGGNIADDCLYSGTIGAALEGAQAGIRSIAMSQVFDYWDGSDLPWDCAEKHGPELVTKLLKSDAPKSVVYNINFPNRSAGNIEGMQVTSVGSYIDGEFGMDERLDGRGVPYYWLAFRKRTHANVQGTDLKAIHDGHVSVTPIHKDFTAYGQTEYTQDLLGG